MTIHDTTPTTHLDLSAQFYLTEADIGAPRAAASVAKLAELNQYVRVSLSDAPLEPGFLQAFSCVVMVNAPLDVQIEVRHSRATAAGSQREGSRS